jgi:hypothetical protein
LIELEWRVVTNYYKRLLFIFCFHLFPYLIEWLIIV